jgi:hypothetical protein
MPTKFRSRISKKLFLPGILGLWKREFKQKTRTYFLRISSRIDKVEGIEFAISSIEPNLLKK